MSGIAVKLPLYIDSRDGAYALTKTIRENIKQNLKNLILTAPGERAMDPNFGVGIRNYLFENSLLVDITKSRLETKISNQIETYMPFLEILEILIREIPDLDYGMNVQIIYFIRSNGSRDSLSLNVEGR
jgi:uncharacterized protein